MAKSKSPVTPALRKKFLAAWIPKAMMNLRKAVELGVPPENCMDYDHMLFWIALYQPESTEEKRRKSLPELG